jgi:hypothetical protein
VYGLEEIEVSLRARSTTGKRDHETVQANGTTKTGPLAVRTRKPSQVDAVVNHLTLHAELQAGMFRHKGRTGAKAWNKALSHLLQESAKALGCQRDRMKCRYRGLPKDVGYDCREETCEMCLMHMKQVPLVSADSQDTGDCKGKSNRSKGSVETNRPLLEAG